MQVQTGKSNQKESSTEYIPRDGNMLYEPSKGTSNLLTICLVGGYLMEAVTGFTIARYVFQLDVLKSCFFTCIGLIAITALKFIFYKSMYKLVVKQTASLLLRILIAVMLFMIPFSLAMNTYLLADEQSIQSKRTELNRKLLDINDLSTKISLANDAIKSSYQKELKAVEAEKKSIENDLSSFQNDSTYKMMKKGIMICLLLSVALCGGFLGPIKILYVRALNFKKMMDSVAQKLHNDKINDVKLEKLDVKTQKADHDWYMEHILKNKLVLARTKDKSVQLTINPNDIVLTPPSQRPS